MAIPLLFCGMPYTLVTNGVYALPIGKLNVFTGDPAATLEQSAVSDFSTKAAVTLVGGMAALGGAFIRATAGNPTIILSKD